MTAHVAPAIDTPIRIRELDALRGIAALLVVLYHYTTRYEQLYDHPDPLLWQVPWGHHGVDLFFMISGFVILMTLDRARTVRDFAVARFSRLFPAFWTACALTLLVTTVLPLPGDGISWTDAGLNLTMIPKALGAEYIDGVYWTLQTELIFYCVAGLTVALGGRRHLLLVMGALVLLDAAGVRVGGRFRLFLVGVVFYESLKGLGWRHALLLAIAALAVIRHETWEGACIIAAMAGAVFIGTRAHLPLLANPLLVFAGTISYSLYLVHQNIGYVVIRLGYHNGLGPQAAIAVAVGVCILVATGLTFVVERPANRALRAWLARPRRARTRGATVPAVAPVVTGMA